MDYTRLIVHPLGGPEVLEAIDKVIAEHDGYIMSHAKLGIPMLTVHFADGEKAAECAKILNKMDEVSHIDWAETA